jgi:hypothetical protein
VRLADIGWQPARRPLAWSVGAAIVAGALLLRLWDIDRAAIWSDEILTRFRAEAPLGTALESIAEPGNQAPLFFLLMRAVPHASATELRLPSALLGAAAVALLIVVVARLLGSAELALWSGGLLAISPLFVDASRTGRTYPLLVVISLGVVLAFMRLQAGDRGRGAWALFVALSALAYLTHLSALVLPVAQAGVLAATRRTSPGLTRPWLLAQGLALAPLLAWMGYVAGHAESGPPGREVRASIGDLPVSVWNLATGFDGRWAPAMAPALIAAGIGLALGIAGAWRERERRPAALLLALMAAMGLVAMALTALAEPSVYRDRYLTIVLPAVLVVMAFGWMGQRLVVRSIALSLIALSAAGVTLANLGDERTSPTDWRGVIAHLDAVSGPRDRLLFERWTTREAFLANAGGDRPPGRVLTLDESPDAALLDGRGTRVWAVFRNPQEDLHRQGWTERFDPLEEVPAPMAAWLAERRVRIAGRAVFTGVVVLRLDPPRGGLPSAGAGS